MAGAPGSAMMARAALRPTVSASFKASELYFLSSVAGCHYGRFLCPDGSGILRPHWVSHALHWPLDHRSDHLLGGLASL